MFSADPLNRRHGAAAALDSLCARSPTLEGQQRPHEHRQHGVAQLMIVGELVAQPVWEGQHPLAHGQVAEDAVDEVSGEHAHAPTTARRTEAAPLAGEAFVGLCYFNPPGGIKQCLNTKIASCDLVVSGPGGSREKLVTAHRAAFEILTDSSDHGIPLSC